jgi:hypothetical protein
LCLSHAPRDEDAERRSDSERELSRRRVLTQPIGATSVVEPRSVQRLRVTASTVNEQAASDRTETGARLGTATERIFPSQCEREAREQKSETFCPTDPAPILVAVPLIERSPWGVCSREPNPV